jgi:hypothetical protein
MTVEETVTAALPSKADVPADIVRRLLLAEGVEKVL